MLQAIVAIDRALAHELNTLISWSPVADSVIVFFAQYVIFILAACAVLVLLKARPTFQNAVSFFFPALLAYGFGRAIQYFFFRARPFSADPSITELFVPRTESAFPSLHATVMFALVFALFPQHKKIGYLLGVCAFVSGAARVVAGVHFPLDILGGFVLALITTFLMRLRAGRVSQE